MPRICWQLHDEDDDDYDGGDDGGGDHDGDEIRWNSHAG
jgi:hypothetical protein